MTDSHIVIYHWYDEETKTWRPDYEEPGYDKSRPFGYTINAPIDYWNDKPLEAWLYIQLEPYPKHLYPWKVPGLKDVAPITYGTTSTSISSQ
jgi:hypothetical protein